MDSSKIGKYIKEKRNQNNLTQTDLAEHLLTSRENVSKWERGLAIPNTEYLKLLCEKLNISVMELLTAQDNVSEPQEEIVYNLLYKKEKYRKIIKYITFLLCTLLISFLGYFFITNYKSLRVYIISSDSEELHLHDSLFVLSNDKIYITLNSVENIDYMKIYYEEDNEKYFLFGSEDNKNTFIYKIKNNNVINKKNADKIFKNLYLEYTIGEETKVIKLKIYKDYENAVSSENKFSKKESDELINPQNISTPEDDNIIEINDKNDIWQICGNDYNIIKYKSKYAYNIKNNSCVYGECDEMKIKKFIEKYYENGEWNK